MSAESAWGRNAGSIGSIAKDGKSASSSFKPLEPYETAKLIVSIEQELVKADSYCMHRKDLIAKLLGDPELRSLMFNVAGVNGVIDGMIQSGKIDNAAYTELGIVSLTQKYFEQFQDPELLRHLGKNAEARRYLGRMHAVHNPNF